MNATEFLKWTSPNDKFGVKADLERHKLTKHVIQIMERYAKMKVDEKCEEIVDMLISEDYENLAERI